MSVSRVSLLALILISLSVAGWCLVDGRFREPAAVDHRAAERMSDSSAGSVTSRQTVSNEPVPQSATDSVDRAPARDDLQPSARSQPRNAGDGTAVPVQSPVLQGLQQLITTNDALQDAGQTGQLSDMLVEADDILTRVRQENSQALRNVGREIRVNASRWPNILLIVADGLSMSDLGCYSNQQPTPSPVIDSLAEAGMRFDAHYAPASTPVLSRYGLMTGRSAAEVAGIHDEVSVMRSSRSTLASMLWQAGYATGFVGTWSGDFQTPPPLALEGYDTWSGIVGPAADETYPRTFWSGSSQIEIRSNADGQQKVKGTELLIQDAGSVLSQLAETKRPFFLHMSLAVEEAGVPEFDQAIRTLITKLPTTVSGNTLVVVTAESAEVRQSEKDEPRLRIRPGELYDGSIRVPLVIWWPATIKAGSVCRFPTTACDLLPTLRDISGTVQRPQSLAGVSLSAMFRKQTPLPERLIYWMNRAPSSAQAVRLGKWKAVKPDNNNDVELYNLEQDPGETANVADQHKDIIARVIRQPDL